MCPLFDDLDLAELRDVVESDLTDVVTLLEAQMQDLGHGGETGDLPPITTGPFAGLLLPATDQVKEQAAARGIAATYVLQLPIGPAVRPGLTATVVRYTVNESWTRSIAITGVELPRDVCIVCTAVDVPLDVGAD